MMMMMMMMMMIIIIIIIIIIAVCFKMLYLTDQGLEIQKMQSPELFSALALGSFKQQ